MPPTILLAFALVPQEPVPETVVTAPRAEETITHSRALVTEISGEELRRTGARSLPRAIELAAPSGVWMQETNLGGGSPFVRGLTGNQILIVVDGVRINDSTTRIGPNQNLNTIDVATVERVVIRRGPAAVEHGSDAIGGVVEIWTKRRRPAGAGGERGFDTGYDLQYVDVVDGGRASVMGAYGWEHDALLGIGSLWDLDDLESGGGTVPSTGYHGNAVFGAWEHAFGPLRDLRITASIHRDFDVPRTDRLITGFGQTQPSNEFFDFALQERERYVLAYTDRTRTAIADRSVVRLSYRRYVEEREKQSTGSDTFTFERDEVGTYGLGIDFVKALPYDQLLTYGFDVEHDEVDSSRTDLDLGTGGTTPQPGAFAPDARYVRAGLFARDEIPLPWFDATIGGRWSYFDFGFDADGGGEEDGSFDAFTASLQLARTVAEGVRVTGTLAQGFRAPNLDDLANEKTFAGGTELPNPDLDPERSWTAELAVDVARGPWTLGAGVFYTEVDDLIGRVLVDEGDPGTTGDETFLRENTGELEIHGTEAWLRRRLGDTPLYAAASATWTRGKEKESLLDPDDGEVDARRIPPLFGRVALEVRQDEPRFGVSWADVEVRWATEQDDLHPQDVSDPRIDPEGTDGWVVLNLDVGGPVPGSDGLARWRAGLHNVFDERYRVHGSGFDAPGRGFVLGLHYGAW